MSVESARSLKRLRCPREVTVNDLSGGESFTAEIAHLGSGGARLIVDRPMAPGHVVRLIFPREKHSNAQTGPMILGQVVRSRHEAGKSLVRVAFGWDADFKDKRQHNRAKNPIRSWLRSLSAAADRIHRAVSRGS